MAKAPPVDKTRPPSVLTKWRTPAPSRLVGIRAVRESRDAAQTDQIRRNPPSGPLFSDPLEPVDESASIKFDIRIIIETGRTLRHLLNLKNLPPPSVDLGDAKLSTGKINYSDLGDAKLSTGKINYSPGTIGPHSSHTLSAIPEIDKSLHRKGPLENGEPHDLNFHTVMRNIRALNSIPKPKDFGADDGRVLKPFTKDFLANERKDNGRKDSEDPNKKDKK